MTKEMGFLTRETNSSHASSSRGPAQRQTTSFRDKDEYRVGLGVLDIPLFPVGAWGRTCARISANRSQSRRARVQDQSTARRNEDVSRFCQQLVDDWKKNLRRLDVVVPAPATRARSLVVGSFTRSVLTNVSGGTKVKTCCQAVWVCDFPLHCGGKPMRRLPTARSCAKIIPVYQAIESVL